MATRIGFVTCVQLGLSCIQEITELGGRFDLLVTLRDDLAHNKSGRVYLDDIAQQHSMPLAKIRHINDPDSLELLKSYELDWLFVIGWSQILSDAALESAHRGVIGMHPTLLPVGRGRAAVPWAILKGLDQTGVTMFQLDGGVDTGPIIAQQVVPIAAAETATTLYEKVNDAHRLLMRNAWPLVIGGEVQRAQQDEALATEWAGRRPQDGRVTGDMSVLEVDRLVRATTRPYPGAFVDTASGARMRLWAGSTEPPGCASYQVTAADGTYFATEFEYDSLTQAEVS